jgi:stage V sporulation protein AF
MLSGSLSVIGGLILGESAVQIGWFSNEVIFYMALVAIASFTQHNYELGYAFKFLRMLLLALTGLFRIWGFFAGVVLIFVLLCTNKTVNGGRSYLYPLIPFNGKAFARLFLRLKKRD